MLNLVCGNSHSVPSRHPDFCREKNPFHSTYFHFFIWISDIDVEAVEEKLTVCTGKEDANLRDVQRDFTK